MSEMSYPLMPMSEPQIFELTIAIPTFNRFLSLDKLLSSLAVQEQIERVQVLVSNNGSTDRTSEVLTRYGKKLNLKSVGFSENRGFDANYLNCVEHADGRYLWIMGDDDNLVSGAVRTVLENICRDTLAPIDLIIVNGGDYRQGQLDARVKYPVEKIRSASSLMEQVGWHICWIGTTIVRRKRLKSESLTIADSNAFIHIPLLVRSFEIDWKVDFFPEILLHTTVNNSEYFNTPLSLVRTFGNKLFMTLQGLNNALLTSRARKSTVGGFAKNLPMFNLRNFAAWRRDRVLNIVDFGQNWKYFYRVNPLTILYAGMLFLPPVFFRILSAKEKNE